MAIEHNSIRYLISAPNGMLMKQIAFAVNVQPSSVDIRTPLPFFSLANTYVATGTLNLSTTEFYKTSQANTVIDILPGRTLFVCSDLRNTGYNVNSYEVIVRGNKSTNENTLTYTINTSGMLYRMINYDIGNWVYFLDSNYDRIIQFHTATFNTGLTGPDQIIFRDNHFVIPSQNVLP